MLLNIDLSILYINSRKSPNWIRGNKDSERKKRCGVKEKLKNSIFLLDIQDKLEEGWTPEQISGRYGLKGQFSISFKTIYRAIKNGLLLQHTVDLLPRHGKKRQNGNKETRGRIPDKKMIEERPKEADDRSEIGHFESDTIVGKGRHGAIMTYVCRKSRYLIAELMPDRRSSTFNQATIDNFKYIPSKYVKTFTSDNGKEFSNFKELEDKLGVESYFANPYHSWERGTNENTNGLLRRYFPKGTDFMNLTKKEVNNSVYAINNRPRKCLKWKTPQEVFWGEIECCI
ncbi:IS30 family transposase [uncultured Ilyobacter sp.]|uniref:IS30 family transposase n=1 Tax=uncultured Ilyobacter sp. TaxID=544433 RepID=UPI0029C6DE19|nr:IS30 family transposase [uncultured Ilyobacter sp.]